MPTATAPDKAITFKEIGARIANSYSSEIATP